ncbi:MAG: PilZ domain-containing protein [Thermodesulfobacteriota bacterium]
MNTGGGKRSVKERREHERYEFVSPIIFLSERNKTDKPDGNKLYTYARMLNYSAHGLYFESDYRLEAGSWVFFKLARLSDDGWRKGALRGYGAKIKWCRPLASTETFGYGIGAEYVKPFTILRSEFDVLVE